MKIRSRGPLYSVWLVCLFGSAASAILSAGEEVKVSDKSAVRLVEGGAAVGPGALVNNKPAVPSKTREVLLAEWLAEHAADVIVNQVWDPKYGAPRGTIRIGAVVGDLGETPPLWDYKIKTCDSVLLVGHSDTRHAFKRFICSVEVKDGQVLMTYGLRISYPREWATGGVVFRRSEKQISEVGILVGPSGEAHRKSQSREMLEGMVLTQNFGFVEETLSTLPSEGMGDIITLLPLDPSLDVKSAKILWLKVDNGRLEADTKSLPK